MGQWIDRLAKERHDTLDWMLRSYEIAATQYHRMIVLAAGVLAIVPALLTQAVIPVNTWFVRRGVTSLLVTVAIGVVIEVVGRYAFRALVTIYGDWNKKLSFRIGEATAAADFLIALAEAYEKWEQEIAPGKQAWNRLWLAGIAGDVLFYGTFMYGAWCLLKAVYH